MSISNNVKKLTYYLPGFLCLILFVAYGFGDYWVIGVIANPDEIARYNFGAEAKATTRTPTPVPLPDTQP